MKKFSYYSGRDPMLQRGTPQDMNISRDRLQGIVNKLK